MTLLMETERTYISELLQDDAPAMFEMDSDPEVHRYVGQQPTETLEKTRQVIDYIRQQYTDNGIGRWAVVDKQTDRFIGWTGFKLIKETIN